MNDNKRMTLINNNYKCPICEADVICNENSVHCAGIKQHCFDFSASGYLNLAFNKSSAGDSKEAIKARTAFLNTGAFYPILCSLKEIITHYMDKGIIIDAGCGEGYYTNGLAYQTEYSVIGFDLSKFGVDNAAKTAKRRCMDNVAYSVASIFAIPLKNSIADCIVNIFSPCAQDEFFRILKKDGILILCSAGKEHLYELKKLIYNEVYINEERYDLPKSDKFILLDRKAIKFDICVEGNDNIQSLFSMTPYYWRTKISDKEKLKSVEKLTTTVEIDIYIFRKKPIA